MTWNYRVIRTIHDEGSSFAIHEVHYDENGNITGWTVEPVNVTSKSIKDQLWALGSMRECCSKPVLVIDPNDPQKLVEETK